MANNKRMVEAITSRDEDFAKWYTDIVKKAELVDYSGVKGCMVIRPYGYAIWENIQADLDRRFKETGHENVYMPMFIPESLLQKEKDHVEGFAPECAWVTIGGQEKLQERLCVRPTSETLFCEHYKKIINTYRDLPKLYNQWCSVVRWEKTTRPFLRTSEFLWQEGHTLHATPEEAQEETLKMLHVYEEFARNVLAMPVLIGQKSEKEKFAGAQATYSMEAMMHDGKSLQAGTTHYFGTNFSEAFDIKFLDKDGTHKNPYQTSWGTSTRMIGAIIMTHGDQRGLCLPPYVAPVQAVVIPIAAHKGGVMEKAEEIYNKLKAAGIRVKLDDSDNSPGWKFNEYEMKGVPVRIEIGPRDIENGVVTYARRDKTGEKFTLAIDGIENEMPALLHDIHENMYQKALDHLNSHIKVVHNTDELREAVDHGNFGLGMWCGCRECEDKLKADMQVTTRNMPFDQTPVGDKCVVCGKPAKKKIYFGRAY